MSNSNGLEECELILNKWVEKNCRNMEMLVVNNIPILAEDCLSIFKGSVTNVKDYTNKIVVTTKSNRNYVLESFQ